MPIRVSRQHVEVLGTEDPNMRVSRQFVEVLGSEDNIMRVSRQHVEVLGVAANTITENLTDNMTITDDVHVTDWYESLTDNMSITQTLPTTFFYHIDDDLNLQQQAGQVHEENVSDPITFVEYLTNFKTSGEYAPFSDTMTITQEVAFSSGLFNVMEDVMSISDAVNAVGPIYREPWTRIVMTDGMPYENKFERIEDELSIIDSAGREYEENVTDPMSITDDMYRSGNETTTMTLVQSLDWGKTKGIPIQLLNLVQTIALRGNWTRSAIDTLGVGHAFTYYIEDPCNKKDYTVFKGESTVTGQPTPPDDDLPTTQPVDEDTRFLLLYPALGEATDIVELRAPNLDNRERQTFTRINRETRGGRLVVFSDPTWPSVNSLVLSFTGLTKTEVEDVQDFMVGHIGKEVGLIDWEGHLWRGLITTPDERAIQEGKNGPCGGGRFTISFEFEGTLVEDETPSGSAMTISDSVVYTVV